VPEPPGPEEIARRFLQSLERNEPQSAWELVAVNEGIPAEIQEGERRDLEEAAKLASSGSWHTTVVESRQDGCAAVVIVIEDLKRGQKATDYDPWYLVRTTAGWRILPMLTNHEVANAFVTEQDFASFEKLATWFEVRKSELMSPK
jgi:hypothetical protein